MNARRVAVAALVAALLVAGCSGARAPRVDARHARVAYENREQLRELSSGGGDTAYVSLSFPWFTAAGTDSAADSLNAAVLASLIADPIGEAVLRDTLALMERFLASWADAKEEFGTVVPWSLMRTVLVETDTLGVVTLAIGEEGYMGGAHGFGWTHYQMRDAASGRRLGLDDLVVPGGRDSLMPYFERDFRASHQLAPRDDLEDAGFWFERNRFAINDNIGLTRDGLRVGWDSYEIAPYVMGPSEATVPWPVFARFLRPERGGESPR